MRALAVVLSLALHALGLWWLGRSEVTTTPVARAPTQLAWLSAQEPAEVPEAAAPPRPTPARRRSAPASEAAPAVAESPSPAAEGVDEPTSGAPTAVEETTGTTGVGEPRETEGVPAPGPRDVGDEVDVAALVHARLAAVADGCYPAAARRFRQRGTATLSFCSDAAGVITGGRVSASSGASMLDTAARECVLNAASPLPLPAAGACFSVPVRFGGP